MAGRGPQSFKKRQKEQQRKEKQQEKNQKRVERQTAPRAPEDELVVLSAPLRLPEFMDDEDEPAKEEDSDESLSRVGR
jgi:hypothetical protein